MDRLIFLGTAGARVMVSKQLTASGGVWIELAGSTILLDPGPGSLVQATKRGLRPDTLDAIVLSHRHLDHSGDANVMVEAMTGGGLRRGGLLLAPEDALEGDDPVVLRYLRPFLARIETLTEGGTYHVGALTLRTPVRHQHPGQTFGVIVETEALLRLAFLVDTRPFAALEQHYRADVLVLNVVRLEPGSGYDHLSIPEAQELIGALRPRLALLTHFGMTVWRAHPWELAARMSDATGIRVLAARDGMTIDLQTLEVQKAPRRAGREVGA